MGFFDDVVGGVKRSGIPGYSQAAGLFSGVTGIGADPEAGPAPEYNPYTYNEGAFTLSDQYNQDTGNVRNMLQNNLGNNNAAEYQTALQAQQAAALGQGPSIAEMQLRQGMAQNNQMIQSAAGSARGAGAVGLAQMGASNLMSRNNQQLNQQQGLLRAQEQEMARQGLFRGIESGRQMAIAGQNQQLTGYNQLGNREALRLNSAQALEQAKAQENAAKQGRQFQNWSNTTAAAAQDEANQQQAAQANQQTVVQAAGMFDKNRK